MQNSAMAYLFLALGLVSLGGLGILHKTADYYRCRPSAVNMFLFVWAGLISTAILVVKIGPGQLLGTPSRVMMVAGVCGGLGSIAILTLQHALRHGKISTSWLVINLSTAIPTVLSILIYREEVGLRRGLSFLLVVLALLLLWWDRRKTEMLTRHEDQTSPKLTIESERA